MSTETNVTPAQELRAAASKIGEIAGQACAGPWRNRGGQIEGNGTRVATAAIAAGHDSAEHIALWNPGVARLVGDWLESEAYGVEASLAAFPDVDAENLVRWPLAIARAINGGA